MKLNVDEDSQRKDFNCAYFSYRKLPFSNCQFSSIKYEQEIS